MSNISFNIPYLVLFVVIVLLLFILGHLGIFELFVAAPLTFWAVTQFVKVS